MVNLFQVLVILLLIVVTGVVVGSALYALYSDNTTSPAMEIIEIISNQTGLSNGAENGSGPNQTTSYLTGNITLPSNVQILQNEINDTRYTAILITENLTSS